MCVLQRLKRCISFSPAAAAISLCIGGAGFSNVARAEAYLTFGLGSSKCSQWLTNDNFETPMQDWLTGFWSGRNFGAARSAQKGAATGHSTDVYGFVGAVKLACQHQPSLTVDVAANSVWERFRDEQR